MKLELDDFTTIDKLEKKSEELKEEGKKAVEEIEAFYQQKIAQMERHYQELLRQETQKAYQQGFEEAKAECQQECQERLGTLEQQLNEKKKQELAQIKAQYEELEKELHWRYTLFITQVSDIIAESLGEILEFLFVDDSNIGTIKEAIDKLLEEFGHFVPVAIEANGQLYEELKKRFETIEIKRNETLNANEFIIEFDNFRIENRIKEKIGVIKDEIKREIKKLT